MRTLILATLMFLLISKRGGLLAQENGRLEKQAPDHWSNGKVEMVIEDPAKTELTSSTLERANPSKPGRIVIRLKNISHEVIQFMAILPEWDFSFDVRDSSGHLVEVSPAGKKLPQSDKQLSEWLLARSVVRLAPGEEYVGAVDLSIYYQLQPGQTYTVNVTRGSRGAARDPSVLDTKAQRSQPIATAVTGSVRITIPTEKQE